MDDIARTEQRDILFIEVHPAAVENLRRYNLAADTARTALLLPLACALRHAPLEPN